MLYYYTVKYWDTDTFSNQYFSGVTYADNYSEAINSITDFYGEKYVNNVIIEAANSNIIELEDLTSFMEEHNNEPDKSAHSSND